MQQFCTYGSVRGALGQLASLPRQKAFSLPLAHARGSVTASESTAVFLSRDREGAVRSILVPRAGAACAMQPRLFFSDPRYGFGAVRALSPALSFDWGRL